MGAGIAAGGWSIADWDVVGKIAASWVISPVLGGIIAAGFLYLIKRQITYQVEILAAARRTVPLLIGIMAWSFTTYLILKGLKHVWKLDFATAALIGFVFAVGAYMLMRAYIARLTPSLANDKEGVNEMFTIPLIFAAALLSFAHGANDVANAVGPLAGINDAVVSGGIIQKAQIPLWVMLVGALGIALGLALYGPKLIRTVGSEITELDKTRAFCIALAAAITVIVASQLGLPVSSTHIAVGGVFGVGFLREYLKVSYSRKVEEIKLHHQDNEPEAVTDFLERFEAAPVQEKGEMLRELKKKAGPGLLHKRERKELSKIRNLELVKRTLLLRIAGAWLVTVPVAGILGAMIFFMIRGVMLP